MIAVFLAFVAGEDPATKMFGLGLATAIFIDATLVRMVLVPATMTLLGDANWWLPALARPHPAEGRPRRRRPEAGGVRARRVLTAACAGVHPGAGARVLYGQLLGYGFWVASGVVEEKSSRVVEVLLATIRPRQLLLGKVLGIGALGLVQLVALAVVGLGLAVALGSLTWSADLGVAILTSFAWFLLGFTFYAAGYAAGAARVSRQEDLQNVVTPLNLMAIASFFGSIIAINAGDSVWVQVFSVIPPFSALMQPSLIAAGDSSPALVVLAVVLMLVAIAGMVVLAARVYERSVLRTGSPITLRESLRG